ncbi:MAG: DNA mismatch repair endonuclease MutL [Pseudomonadota bacterium]
MALDDRKIRPVIRPLDEAAINRIAAGEVVERPASAVKELVENALDSWATRVSVDVAAGGKALIRVTDDGCGIPASEMPLAVARHATSKIDGSDLLNIESFGFRGEALASLGAVGRLTLTSRVAGAEAHRLTVDGGRVGALSPAAGRVGTAVELRDLFYATPARLKFLKTEKGEMQAITDVVKRLAMTSPSVAFTLSDETKVVLRLEAERGEAFEALSHRLGAILGKDFTDNAIAVDAVREGLRLWGYAALPTYSRGAAVAQFLFVNGRPVRDKQLTGALRAAYADFLSRDRHPAAVLFLDCPLERVDVNVHPAKAEVRFRDPGIARGLIVSGLRHALAEAGHRAATTVAGAALGAFRTPVPEPRVYQMDRSRPGPAPSVLFEPAESLSAAPVPEPEGEAPLEGPLGAARAQLHRTYIVAQTEDGIVLVDQHAAHERLVYETLKEQAAANGVPSQALLVPEIVELSEPEVALLLAEADALGRFGLELEPFGPGAIAVRATPALLGPINAEALVRDILDELRDSGGSLTVQAKVEAVLSRVACHGSIRAGRAMGADEMNALLRKMEAVPHSGQCNHGRPTYVELKLADIERLFGRT